MIYKFPSFPTKQSDHIHHADQNQDTKKNKDQTRKTQNPFRKSPTLEANIPEPAYQDEKRRREDKYRWKTLSQRVDEREASRRRKMKKNPSLIGEF